MGRACSRHERDQECIQGFYGKRKKEEGKRPIERPRGRWEADIQMDLREIGWAAMD
jgi:hypothetical protein